MSKFLVMVVVLLLCVVSSLGQSVEESKGRGAGESVGSGEGERGSVGRREGDVVMVSGHVVDGVSGESVAFASCADVGSGRGAVSNGYGFFSLGMERGGRLAVSCMGYEGQELRVEGDTVVVVRLMPREVSIGEVTVKATVPQVEMTQMSKATVPMGLVSKMPSFTGEPDVMKAITFLPGVSAGRDGMSDVFVRGGDRGQNLILLDGMKVYNSSHLFGLVSLFNSDVVRNVDVYKGIFPAEYGGRLSSVINVLSKDGNVEERRYRVSVGMLSSSLYSEGPIGDGRVTYSVAARAGYNDLFNMAAKRRFYALDFSDPGTYNSMSSNYVSDSFYDVNGRLRWRMGDGSSLTLSGLVGSDFEHWGDAIGGSSFMDREVGRTAIRNDAVSLTYVRSFGSVFWRSMVAYTSYRNSTVSDVEERYVDDMSVVRSGQSHLSTLRDLSLRSGVEWSGRVNRVKGGVEWSRYVFRPQRMGVYSVDAGGERVDSVVGSSPLLRSMEGTVYVQDEVEVTPRWSVEVGLRGTGYVMSGARWWRVEPRLSTRYLVSDRLSLKAGYTRSNQFNHSVLSYVGDMESEAWVAATEQMPPQRADQVAVGAFFADDMRGWNVSVEGYYKWMGDLLHYRSMKVLDNGGRDLDRSVETGGEGRSYGVEMSVAKDLPKGVSVNVGYTWSVSERRFGGVNGGAWFPSAFDRRHQLTVVGLWKPVGMWDVGATFNMASGRPFTMPSAFVGKDYVSPVSYHVYSDINNRRAPLYHRLDLSASRDYETRGGVRMRWGLNIFNVYGRKNPSVIRYSGSGSRAEMMSDYTILPSVSYSIWF